MQDTVIETERLVLRPWAVTDAEAALPIYGDAEVTGWLAPAMSRVPDVSVMTAVLEQWVGEAARLLPPAGRWALQAREDGRLVGGVVLLPLPPRNEDLEMGWVLHPAERRQGFATEAGRALARWGFDHGSPELFAVAASSNTPAIRVATRMGMQWVGETEKYYDLLLQVYRVRPAELNQ